MVGLSDLGYTTGMELAVLIALGVVVAIVGIDAIRSQPKRPGDDQSATTQKIIVDLSKRR